VPKTTAAVAEVRASQPPEPKPMVTTAVSQAAEPIPREEAVPEAAASNLEALWTEIVEAVGRASPFTRTYLLEAHPVSLGKNIFTIGFDPEFKDHLGLVDNGKNRTIIETKLHELGHANVHVKFVEAPAPPGRVRAPSTPSGPAAGRAVPSSRKTEAGPEASPAVTPEAGRALTKEDFKNDPLIKKALEIFKGQIVEVRS
jgi:hypothetical protein